jgi:succinate dehydrogenase / fumarate reductase cytochrome b subunit
MSEMTMNKKRPKYLTFAAISWEIKLPLPGFVSILHRVSGAFLFLYLPLLIWFFQQSLHSPESFDAYKAIASHWFVRLIFLGLLWSYLHHFCAGIRYLLLDLDKGVDLAPARASAWAVLAVSLPLTLILGWALLW